MTLDQQARYLTQAYQYADRFGWVQAMFWYHGRDFSGGDPYSDHYGLTRTDYSLKPSFDAYRSLATANGKAR